MNLFVGWFTEKIIQKLQRYRVIVTSIYLLSLVFPLFSTASKFENFHITTFHLA